MEDAPYTSHQISCSCMLSSGASWPSSRPLSRNVAVLKVQCPWKIGGHKRGREPSSQTPTDDTPATAGKQAIAGMLAAARIPALSKGHQQEKAQPKQQKCQQQQDLCGKAIKVARNEARNMAVNVAVKKKIWLPVKGPQMAVVFAGSGSDGVRIDRASLICVSSPANIPMGICQGLSSPQRGLPR